MLAGILAAIGFGLSVATLIAKPGARPVLAILTCLFAGLIYLTAVP